RQRVLLDVNNAIVTCLDRDSLFTAIAAALGRAIPFDRSARRRRQCEGPLPATGGAQEGCRPAGSLPGQPEHRAGLRHSDAVKQPTCVVLRGVQKLLDLRLNSAIRSWSERYAAAL